MPSCASWVIVEEEVNAHGTEKGDAMQLLQELRLRVEHSFYARVCKGLVPGKGQVGKTSHLIGIHDASTTNQAQSNSPARRSFDKPSR